VLRVATIAVAALALFAVPASANTFSAEHGAVKATVTYNKSGTKRLTITRNGAVLFDAAPAIPGCETFCGPSGFPTDPPLRVLDLDGDGEPEVVYSAYSGGAHCCTVVRVYWLKATADGYDPVDHNFGDPGFRVQDLNGDGRPEFVTADDAFAYRFTAYAFSGLPIEILRYTPSDFLDVTGHFPALVRRDARRWRTTYLRAHRRRDRTQQGSAAAWAADEYRLGRRRATLRFLRREVRHGHLHAHFVKDLDRFLHFRGY
jgi:VCBS repeat protein